MGQDHTRDIDGEIAMAELVEMKNIGTNLTYQLGKEFRGFGKVLRRFVHPLQAESGGPVFETVKTIHPRRLIGQRDLAEGDERHSYAARDQASDQFASVGPGAGHRIGGDQNVQDASGSIMDSASSAGSSESR
jgi:hypothetical protein